MFNFKSKKSMFGVLTLSATLVLSGCQGGIGGNKDVDPRLTSGNQAEFFSKSGLQACGMGALAGVGVCLLSNASNKVVCSAIAAVAACGILMGTNYYFDQQRKTYENKEQRLDAYLKDLNKNTDEVKMLTNSAKNVLADNQRTLANLDKQLKAGAIQKDAAKAELKKVDKNLAYLNDKLAKMKDSEKGWRDIAAKESTSGMKVQKLNAQINQYQKQISALEKQVALVSKQRNALNVG